MSCLVLLVLLKISNQQKLLGYFTALFSSGFIAKKNEERASFFNLFNLVLLFFSSIVFGLFFTLVAAAFFSVTFNFLVFTAALGLVFFTSISFQLLELILLKIFDIQDEIGYFLHAKLAYTHNVSLLLFPVLVIFIYNDLNCLLLLVMFVALFLLSLLLLLVNNKNLIVSKLFYFILYICALKIAPLFMLYKIMV